MKPSELRPWFNSLGGVLVAGQATTRRQTLPGHDYDYFEVVAGLLSRTSSVLVDEAAETFPHRPAALEVLGADQALWCKMAWEPCFRGHGRAGVQPLPCSLGARAGPDQAGVIRLVGAGMGRRDAADRARAAWPLRPG